MIIILGLGNPGKKYNLSRHNLGFLVLDSFQEKNGFPKFIDSKKIISQISKNLFEKKEIILAKPQTFMNNSGKSAKKLLSFFKTKPSDLIIVHDDIDLELGTIRITKNRGSAGHKGVESVIKELKTNDFTRLRIGIMPKKKTKYLLEEFVLKNFTENEKEIIKKSIKQCINALEMLLEQGTEKAMSQFN